MVPKHGVLAGTFLALVGLPLTANAARAARASRSMISRADASFHVEQERMRRERLWSEANLTATMSLRQARGILRADPRATAAALSLVEDGLRSMRASQAPRLRNQATSSLVQKFNPSSSLQKAKNMLGEMIGDASIEYDRLQLECSVFFKKQCGLLETCREDISTANSRAAEQRGYVLSAQEQINICEIRLPRLRHDLHTSETECAERLGYLRRDLSVVLNDIAVMESVLKLTDCSKSLFLQEAGPALVNCTPPCTNVSLAAVGHRGLRQQLARLQTSHAQQLVREGLQELGQLASSAPAPNATVTVFKNPPLPQQALPDDPCAGISYDAGGTAGCSMRTNPNCEKLQNKFIGIQGEILDKRDDLLQEIKELEDSCEETKLTLEEEIESFETKSSSENTKLANAVAGENTAAEEGKMKGVQHSEMTTQLLETRTSCSTKFRNLEAELCALKKIRGELFKMKGDKHPFFQDCQVSDWLTKDCSVSCGGGIQELERTVVMPPTGGGAACPPLKQQQSCSDLPCPVDCKVSEWSGYSACSADCGGGVRERTRTVKVQPRYEGVPCGELTETVPCGMQACDKDCDLAEWSPWSTCSKACDGGTRVRRRDVETAAVGLGKCEEEDDPKRMQDEECNAQPCVPVASPLVEPLKCTAKVDVVLLLDGSGSVGSSGWKATQKFAKKFLGAFKGKTADAQVALLTFSGPYSYPTIKKCMRPSSKDTVSVENDCKIKVVQHFTTDIDSLIATVSSLKWPRGTTLTSLALELAVSEFLQGRTDAERIVLTITDGIPVSPRSTGIASKKAKKQVRLMFGAVRLNKRGLQYMRSWGSRPTKENILEIPTFKDLENLKTVDSLIADMCRTVQLPNATQMVSVR